MGPSYSVASACATSANTIGDAILYLKSGMADVMLAGGADCPITRVWLAAFARMGALSKLNDDPERAMRPFDLRRDGFVLAEGAGILVLERREVAERRGAQIIGRVTGYGATIDAYHMTAPHPEGIAAQIAISNALEMAKVRPEDVDMISAHGTATPLNDKAETVAIKGVFKDAAKSVPVVASKSQIGHSVGAAGGVQAVISMLAIQRGVVPSTINLEVPDPECDLDFVPDGPREQPVSTVLLNQFGFGGHNGCLVFQAP
jgi:3-oxoacyl-[acyl-carrier-protein] synthase II